jgi:hypothetical protein
MLVYYSIYLQILKITLGFVSSSIMGLWKIGLQLTGMIFIYIFCILYFVRD